jgi:hypothetical protein
MSDEYAPYPDVSELMAQRLAQRIATKQADVSTGTLPPPGTFDPYQVLIKKKKMEESGEIDPKTVQQKWPEEDVKKLQDYCTKMGIYGFSSGRMPPLAALALLKKQFGDDYTGVPIEDRIPEGYAKRGTISNYGPNYPYTEAMRKKQILHG